MFNRNILILFLSQSLGYSSISLFILVSGILSADIGPSAHLATLPLTFSILGIATATIPASMLMKRFGRKQAFMLAYVVGILGAGLGFIAAWFKLFPVLCGCAFIIGCFLAFANQFRFAAIENIAQPEKASQIVSFLLLGGVVAAFLGPEIADLGKDLLPKPFAGSFLILIAVFLFSALVFTGFQNPTFPESSADVAPSRPLRTIMQQPAFYIALASAVIAYGVMSFIMTATPISMNQIDGFTFSQSKQVIQWHIAAMFLPSVLNIFLFRFLGIRKLMIIGSLIYISMAFVALQGHSFHHYSFALIMLGVGWNFLFVAGTTLLPKAYLHHERFKVQAANDFIVFAIQGIASLAAGWLLFLQGWDFMIKLTIPLSSLMLLLALYYLRTSIKPLQI